MKPVQLPGGGPAFPVERMTAHGVAVQLVASDNESDYVQAIAQLCQGMSVRDYFAAKAMQGFAACEEVFPSVEAMAAAAYRWADAMLKARQA